MIRLTRKKPQANRAVTDDPDREPDIDYEGEANDAHEAEPDPDAPEQDVEENDDPDHEELTRRWIEEDEESGGAGSPPDLAAEPRDA